MATWVESIRRDDLLVIWRVSGYSSDELREISRSITSLPVKRIIALGSAEEIIPVLRAGRKLPVVVKPGVFHSASAQEIIILELDETSLLADPVAIESVHGWMCVFPKIFIGVDGTAGWLRQRYQGMSLTVGEHLSPGVLLSGQPLADGFRRFFHRKFTQVVDGDPMEWLQKEAAGYRSENQQLEANELLAQEPYIFLDSYNQSDAALFHGRRHEIRNLAELSISSPLTVLYGPSGVGKTSLIGAGLLPLLAKNDIMGVQVRLSMDPDWGFSSAQTNQALFHLDTRSPDMLDWLSRAADETNRLIVVVFDQVEELFTLANPMLRERFAGWVKDALTKIPKPVHFVFSIREDYLAHLADLRPHLPRILDRTFGLDALNARQAYEVMVSPAEKCGYQFEAGLADDIIKDLVAENQLIDPVDLQVVCYRLFENAKVEGKRTFLRQDYQELGRAEAILAEFLEGVVARNDCPPGTVEILKGLTTSAGTKMVMPTEDLAQDIRLSNRDVEKVLAWLERPYRLVRLGQTTSGEMGVELRHDVLAKRISGWITDPREQNAKRIKDLLRMDLQSRTRIGSVLSRAKLLQIDGERENPFLKLRADEIALVVEAALHFSDQPEIWLQKLPEGEQKLVLREALLNPDEIVRRKTLNLLPDGESVEILTSNLDQLEEGKRIQNLRTISWLGEDLAWLSLENYRLDSSRTVRSVIWSLLFELNSARAAALKNSDLKRFLLGGSLTTWTILLVSTILESKPVKIPAAGWLVFGVACLFLAGITLAADRIPRLLSRTITVASMVTLLYGKAGIWGALLALVIAAGIGANLSVMAAVLLGFASLLFPFLNSPARILWALPVILAIYALIALLGFSRHMLRRDRMVSWMLLGVGLFWAVLTAFGLTMEFQVVTLVFICGVAFGQIVERASILEDPHGTRYSYVLNLIQKTWSLLHQMPPILRSGLGWLVGSVWAAVLVIFAGFQFSGGDFLRMLLLGVAYIPATWFSDAKWARLVLALMAGSILGFLLGGWAWMMGIILFGSLYAGIVRVLLSALGKR